jgi:hypothetical protein
MNTQTLLTVLVILVYQEFSEWSWNRNHIVSVENDKDATISVQKPTSEILVNKTIPK